MHQPDAWHLREVFDITLVSNVHLTQDMPHVGEMASLCHEFHPARGHPRRNIRPPLPKVLAYSSPAIRLPY